MLVLQLQTFRDAGMLLLGFDFGPWWHSLGCIFNQVRVSIHSEVIKVIWHPKKNVPRAWLSDTSPLFANVLTEPCADTLHMIIYAISWIHAIRFYVINVYVLIHVWLPLQKTEQWNEESTSISDYCCFVLCCFSTFVSLSRLQESTSCLKFLWGLFGEDTWTICKEFGAEYERGTLVQVSSLISSCFFLKDLVSLKYSL